AVAAIFHRPARDRRRRHRSVDPQDVDVSSMETKPVMEGRGLSKRFGHVIALDHSDFDLYAGEVLAIIGDNGAGKSTLIKVLTGALAPDEGSMRLNGEPVD